MTAVAQTETDVSVGIDVSKRHLDVHVHPLDQSLRVENSASGLEQLRQHLQLLNIQSIAIESTGTYERELLMALLDAHAPVALVSPWPVRNFAEGLNLPAGTDRPNARVLARFAHDIQPQFTGPTDPHRENLRELIARRRQLVEERTLQRHHQGRARLEAVRRSIVRIRRHLETELLAIEALIQQQIDAQPDLKVRYETMLTIKGVGPATARVLVSELPELGRIDRRKLAALVGVAPYSDGSGGQPGPGRIRGGRPVVRSALYFATLLSVRCDGVIRDYYLHLRERGKPRKVALVACLRKLLNYLNAVLKASETDQGP